VSGYSYLSATSGSTFIARRAGIALAIRPTRASNIATLVNVSQSVVLTPNSNVCTEYRSVRSDAQRQRYGCNQRKARLLSNAPQREAQVLQKPSHIQDRITGLAR
jgi:hypothetical protein